MTSEVVVLVLQIVGAVLFSIASGGAVVFALSSWLGKVWANRILEAEKNKYARDLETLKAEFQLQIKRAEIKAGAYQKDANVAVTKLHKALSTAHSSCYVFAEMCPTIVRYRPGTDELLRHHLKHSSDALNELYSTLSESALLLSDDLYSRIEEFQKKLWDLRRAMSDSVDTGTHEVLTNRLLEKRDFGELRLAIQDLEKEQASLVTEFRNLIGSNHP